MIKEPGTSFSPYHHYLRLPHLPSVRGQVSTSQGSLLNITGTPFIAISITQRISQIIASLTQCRPVGRMASNVASSSSSGSNVTGAIRLPRRTIHSTSPKQSLSHDIEASASTKNVVVLGGSYGGMHAASVLAQRLPPTHRVILIERNSHFNRKFPYLC
jgi:hypothetical protein